MEKTAEKYGLAVLTTINGKGIISESSDYSGGIVGARGANRVANALVRDADLIFFVGSSTDSAGTASWKFPAKEAAVPMIQLDINEAELGNNYPVTVTMLGDAKATLASLLDADRDYICGSHANIEKLKKDKADYTLAVERALDMSNVPCDPVRLVKETESEMPKDSILVVDPGISAVYPAGFIKSSGGRRDFVCNFAQGSLGYATAAAMGAAKASSESTIVHITGDGSFGFCAGEYETLARTGGNIKVILINNHSFGWIRVSNDMAYGNEPFATEFADIYYVKIVEGFGIPAARLEEGDSLSERLKELFAKEGVAFLEIVCAPEDECVPPVPGWAEKARENGMKNHY
ncbi:MAG: thiamine pyrophosphate-dependent enzyme [Synergistaceae bacterium]|nr:thiamine pyrophosphate-dependent enzyme [Synergistaceae bacterium]